MALPASDPFTGTGTLGANWTITQGTPARVAGVCVFTPAESSAYWSADSFSADHYSQILLSSPQSSAGGGPGAYARLGGTGATTTGYLFAPQTDKCTLYKITGGTTYTVLQDLSSTVTAGDTAYIEVVGTTIKCKKNGTQIGSNQTDAAIASGAAGFYGYTNGNLDDFLADNISSLTAAQEIPAFLLQQSSQLVGAITL